VVYRGGQLRPAGTAGRRAQIGSLAFYGVGILTG
jgi:hypothetical protein